MLVISTLREIKQTFGRYIAILLIIALGVGFFAGLKVTDPAMRQSMNEYLKDNNFYDFRLISTLGFEDEDIDFLTENIDARYVEGSISFDIISDIGESSYVIKAISLPENINEIILESGRMPVDGTECLMDSAICDENYIGKSIYISDSNEDDDKEHFTNNAYTIVGTCKSSLYIQYERGTTTLGSGVLDGFTYMTKDAFDSDVYTDCYVKLDSDYELYSDEYDEEIEAKEDEVQDVLDEVASARYERITSEANDELNDAIEEFETKKADGQTELDNAKAELDNAKKQLDDAKKQISEYKQQETELQAALDEMLSNINQMEALMQTNPSMVDQGSYQTLVATYQQYSANLYTLQSGLKTAQAKYDDGLKEYEEGLEEYESGLAEFNSKIEDAQAEIDDARKEIDDLEEASTYLLTRESNAGYVCFESDSTIVGAIANVFPVFFFLVAALVCMTTMNRMVEDQRTQIGILKALGYSNGSILGKFIAYAGSAAFIGAALGFIAGTIAFPQAIWYAYQMMYNTTSVDYYFSPSMLIISFIVAFICSVGVTFLSCKYEMIFFDKSSCIDFLSFS